MRGRCKMSRQGHTVGVLQGAVHLRLLHVSCRRLLSIDNIAHDSLDIAGLGRYSDTNGTPRSRLTIMQAESILN